MLPSGADVIEKADTIFSANKAITMKGEKTSHPLLIAVMGSALRGSEVMKPKKSLGRHILLGYRSIFPGFIGAHGHASPLPFTSQFVNVAFSPMGGVTGIQDLKRYFRNLYMLKILNLVSGLSALGMMTPYWMKSA